MSDEKNLPIERSKGELEIAHQVELAKELIALEQAKVNVEERAIQASDEQDKRIAEFSTKRLEMRDRAEKRRLDLFWRITSIILLVVVIFDFSSSLHVIFGF